MPGTRAQNRGPVRDQGTGLILCDSENYVLKHKPTHFEELIAWQKAMDLAELTYSLIATWPSSERYGMISQAQRAAVSVPANIAEGHERRSRKEYLRYLGIAAGSLAELETHIELATRIGISDKAKSRLVLDLCHEVGRIIRGIERGLARPPEP